MVNKCVAPCCFVGQTQRKGRNNEEQNAGVKHSKISTFHFPSKAKNKERFERRRNAVPRTNWFPTDNSVLCENHFLAEDFKEERSDKNNSRRTGKGINLQRKELKPNAFLNSVVG